MMIKSMMSSLVMRAILLAVLVCLSSLALAQPLSDQVQPPLIVKGTYGKQPAIYRIFFDIQDSNLVNATLDGVYIEVDTKVDTGNTLLLAGKIDKGKYRESSGISFNSKLSLRAPFEYLKGKISVSIDSGTLDVAVKSSALLGAIISADTLVKMEIKGFDDDLMLAGRLAEGRGRLDENGHVDFDAQIELAEDFNYNQDPIGTTLIEGESVAVRVVDGKFKFAEMDNVQVEVNINTEDRDGPLLAGSITGRYSDIDVHFNGSLTLRDPWNYEQGDVNATLMPGPVEVETKDDNDQVVFTGTLIDGTITSVRLDPVYPGWMSAIAYLESVLIPNVPPLTGTAVIDVERRTNADRPQYRVMPKHLRTAVIQFRIGIEPENYDIRRWFKDVVQPGEIDLLRSRDVTINYVDPSTKQDRVVTLINARPQIILPGNSNDSFYVELQYTGLKISN